MLNGSAEGGTGQQTSPGARAPVEVAEAVTVITEIACVPPLYSLSYVPHLIEHTKQKRLALRRLYTSVHNLELLTAAFVWNTLQASLHNSSMGMHRVLFQAQFFMHRSRRRGTVQTKVGSQPTRSLEHD